MPLYEVVRTDAVEPGGFVNALVIAGGTAQARAAVAHLVPKGAELLAAKVDVRAPRGGGQIRLLTTYHDESPTLDDAFGHDPAQHVTTW
jgi:hypothetical protein